MKLKVIVSNKIYREWQLQNRCYDRLNFKLIEFFVAASGALKGQNLTNIVDENDR